MLRWQINEIDFLQPVYMKGLKYDPIWLLKYL